MLKTDPDADSDSDPEQVASNLHIFIRLWMRHKAYERLQHSQKQCSQTVILFVPLRFNVSYNKRFLTCVPGFNISNPIDHNAVLDIVTCAKQ